jgi:predicted enzyme related to lactoylglutathione lyase
VSHVCAHRIRNSEVVVGLVWYDGHVENRIASLVVDAADAERLGQFWADVLGWQIIKRGGYGVTIAGAGGALEIDFRTVPDGPKAAKNRLHLDIKPLNRGQSDELDRLLALGARRVDVGQRPEVSWYVLADPEGNEFCLCRPDST